MNQPWRKATAPEVHVFRAVKNLGKVISMSNVIGYPDRRMLIDEFPCAMMDGSIDILMITFTWDGNSTPTLILAQYLVPRFSNPIDSAKHDHRCAVAKTKKERRWADNEYRKGILNTPVVHESGIIGNIRYYRKRAWLGVQSVSGWVGVRIGAFLGIGNNF